MASGHRETIPRRWLAIQGGLAILAIVIGASERVEAVRWALYLGHLVLPIVIASWGAFLIHLVLFLWAVIRRIASPGSAAPPSEGRSALGRRFAVVLASVILAMVATVGILPLVM